MELTITPNGQLLVQYWPESRVDQRAGVSWLRFIIKLGLGACLADDMGLGKTVQVVGALSPRKKEMSSTAAKIEGWCPSLLVVPASLMVGEKRRLDSRFRPMVRNPNLPQNRLIF